MHVCWLQVHGFPKVMGVLTHLDGFKDNKRLKKTKKVLKHRFWAEIYQGTDPRELQHLTVRALAWVLPAMQCCPYFEGQLLILCTIVLQ